MISFNKLTNDVTAQASSTAIIQIKMAWTIQGHLFESQQVINIIILADILSPSQDLDLAAGASLWQFWVSIGTPFIYRLLLVTKLNTAKDIFSWSLTTNRKASE